MEDRHFLVGIDIGSSIIKYTAIPLIGGLPHTISMITGAIDASYRPLSEDMSGHAWDTLYQPVRGQYGKTARQSGGVVQRDSNIYDSPAYRVYEFAPIAELLNTLQVREEHIIIDELCLGFPNSHESRAHDVAATLLNNSKPWPVAMAGLKREYHVQIQRVYAQTQPYYAALDQVYQWQGGRFSADRGRALFKSGGFLLLDIGSNSIDPRYQVGSLADSGKAVFMKGMFSILPDLKTRVVAKTHHNPQDHELLHDVLRTGTYTWNGETFAFVSDIHDILRAQWANGLRVEFETFLESLPSNPPCVILAGGGALAHLPVMEAIYPQRFRHGLRLAVNDAGEPEPREAIARGMGKQLMINASKREKGDTYADIRGPRE